VDVEEHLDTRWRAIRAHASQVPPYDAMDADLAREFLRTDHFERVRPPWTGGPSESGLFG
jgi:N-acetyl-1-D-myo-inositol-2-amino-2-deoxy-alpha-D-glucopyranoside deacetylase